MPKLNQQDLLSIISLASMVCEYQPLIQIRQGKDMTTGQHLAVVAELAVSVSNIKMVLKKCDNDPEWQGLLPLPRDGVRWKDRG